jgi:hypothetical protein
MEQSREFPYQMNDITIISKMTTAMESVTQIRLLCENKCVSESKVVCTCLNVNCLSVSEVQQKAPHMNHRSEAYRRSRYKAPYTSIIDNSSRTTYTFLGRLSEFYVLLTVHLDAILGNDQLDALFLNVFIFTPLYVSSSKCSSSGGPNCINTSSGITHSGE